VDGPFSGAIFAMSRDEGKTSTSTSLVALLTDFGGGSIYAGVLKGVIASLAPGVRVVDLTHDVAPQAPDEAGFLLAASYRYFPEGAVFACVVDPGVGTGREIALVEAGGRRFLAPDNGLLAPVLEREPSAVARHVKARGLFLPRVSATFHGRDIFAPVAARLAQGLDPREVGPIVPVESLAGVGAASQGGGGRVVHVDRFGNLVTDIGEAGAARIGALEVGGRRIDRAARTYGEVPAGEPFFYVGSFETVEVAVSGGDAAHALGVERGAPVTVLRR
jgi:hypothetical protein